MYRARAQMWESLPTVIQEAIVDLIPPPNLEKTRVERNLAVLKSRDQWVVVRNGLDPRLVNKMFADFVTEWGRRCMDWIVSTGEKHLITPQGTTTTALRNFYTYEYTEDNAFKEDPLLFEGRVSRSILQDLGCCQVVD